MASQAPSSSSNPLARWLKPVSPAQRLIADQAGLARAQASKKGQPAKQNPVGRPPGDCSVDVGLHGLQCVKHCLTATACGLLKSFINPAAGVLLSSISINSSRSPSAGAAAAAAAAASEARIQIGYLD
eukprot:1160857-Pelagomonas_calceolata.AAC.5